MMKVAIIFIIVAVATAEKHSYENYKVFRVVPKTNEQLEHLRQIENTAQSFDFWRMPSYVNIPVDVMVAPDKIAEFSKFLASSKLSYETYVKNVQELIDNENPMKKSGEFDWEQYHSLEEIYEWLDSLPDKYPGKVETIVAGSTYEGRDIKGVKLTFKPNNASVFIEAGIHAREWIAPATATYIINQFLTSEDPQIRELAESYDWYIVPSVNPDGYVYSHTNSRLWRKTREPSSVCVGTDANRNWDYMWMTVGASSNQCSETYAGKKAFSAIETKTLSDYIKSVGGNLFTYISFHSYSQLLLFPYGHTTQHLENYDDLYEISNAAVKALAQRYGTKYIYGNIAEAIYKASGSSIDYVKGVLKVPLSFTFEFRDTGRYGFILPAKQIIPNGEEVVDSLIALFKTAKKLGYPKFR